MVVIPHEYIVGTQEKHADCDLILQSQNQYSVLCVVLYLAKIYG